jgi:metabotropic X receptor
VINGSPDILPGIKLGAIVIDTCEDEVTTMEQLIDMVKLMSVRELSNMPFYCDDGSEPDFTGKGKIFQKIVGVVGGATSGISVSMASVLRFFELTQVFCYPVFIY